MPYYESIFIARQEISAAQVDGIADNFGELIDKHGGRVTKREYWGLKNLAYRIKKNRKGHYVLFNIDAPLAAVQEYERGLRFHEDILRHLTIKLDELDDQPSAMMQGRTRERAARERRDRDERPNFKAEDTKAAADAPQSTSARGDKIDKEGDATEDKKDAAKSDDQGKAEGDAEAQQAAGKTKKKADMKADAKADKKTKEKKPDEKVDTADETAAEDNQPEQG